MNGRQHNRDNVDADEIRKNNHEPAAFGKFREEERVNRKQNREEERNRNQYETFFLFSFSSQINLNGKQNDGRCEQKPDLIPC